MRRGGVDLAVETVVQTPGDPRGTVMVTTRDGSGVIAAGAMAALGISVAPLPPGGIPTPPTALFSGACAGCGRNFRDRQPGRSGSCTRCKSAAHTTWYCSPDCQRADWPRHRAQCGMTVATRREPLAGTPPPPAGPATGSASRLGVCCCQPAEPERRRVNCHWQCSIGFRRVVTRRLA